MSAQLRGKSIHIRDISNMYHCAREIVTNVSKDTTMQDNTLVHWQAVDTSTQEETKGHPFDNSVVRYRGRKLLQ